ncbi:MAG: NAD-dependent epimerase/dehydratase family protein [Patescibacteria group bacterium]
MFGQVLAADLQAIVQALGAQAHKLSGKTLLVSGSSGFLGRHFLLALQHLNQHVLAKPCKVIAIDSSIVGTGLNTFGELYDLNFTHITTDICAPLSLDLKVDYIVHMAGIASPVYYTKFPLETIRAAVHGTENLLEFARSQQLHKFLVFSSSEIYGDPPDHAIPTPETYMGQVSTLGPRACYDESKRMSETLAITYQRLFGIPVQIIRPFNVYGPGMRPDDRRVVPQFLTCALRDEPLPVHGHGLQTRSYCYISDAITGFLQVMLAEHGAQVHNIGNPHEVSLNELAQAVCALVQTAVIAKIPYPDGYPNEEPMRRCPDISLARSELGYAPQVSLSDGLQRTLIWFKHSHEQDKMQT